MSMYVFLKNKVKKLIKFFIQNILGTEYKLYKKMLFPDKSLVLDPKTGKCFVYI